MDRQELRRRLLESRARLEAELAGYSAADWTTPRLPGGWTPRDVLAHIGWWERWVVDLYPALVGGTAMLEGGITGEQVDALNAETYRRNRDRPLDVIRQEEQQVYQELLDIVEGAPEEDLFDPGRFAQLEGIPLANMLAWNSFDHYEEHLAALQGR